MIRALIFVVAAAFAASVWAAGIPQEKQLSCNREATVRSLKGDARKRFMEACLHAPLPAQAPKAKPSPAPDQAKVCNKKADDQHLRGRERQRFLTRCQAPKPRPAPPKPTSAHR